jgi:hypothetical protein
MSTVAPATSGISSPGSSASLPAAATFAWQGWQLALPGGAWNPLKLEGDYDSGYVLIADLNRPQLGIRWRKMAAKRFDGMKALRGEVGTLAAAKGKPFQTSGDRWSDGAVLFLESEPPGRDVWVAYSRVSGRAIEIVHPIRRRDRVLEDSILPALTDTRPDEARRWAIFDLSCIVPGGYELATHRLNAGDLSLTFACKRHKLTVRQIALAKIALDRLPIEKWLAQQERTIAKLYRPDGSAQEASIDHLTGTRRVSRRRRRFAWMRSLAPQMITYALHDAPRDRLVLVQGDDDSLLRQVATTIGG